MKHNEKETIKSTKKPTELTSLRIPFNLNTCLSFIREHYSETKFAVEDIYTEWEKQYGDKLELKTIENTLNILAQIGKLLKIPNTFSDEDKSQIEYESQTLFDSRNLITKQSKDDDIDENEEETSNESIDESQIIYSFQLKARSQKNESIKCCIPRIKAVLGTSRMTVKELTVLLEDRRQKIRLILDILLGLGLVTESNYNEYYWYSDQEEKLNQIKEIIPKLYMKKLRIPT